LKQQAFVKERPSLQKRNRLLQRDEKPMQSKRKSADGDS